MKIKFILTTLLSIFLFFSNAQVGDFEHAMWQWVEGSKISDKRLNEVAPHFPHPSASNYDMKQYDFAVLKWQKLYCFEYEALINAPELTALNPYYEGYVNIIQMPYFIRPLSSFDKPVYKDTGNTFDDQLDYELNLQAWYFVFHPDQFYKIYKIKAAFPEWFDADAYRAQVIKKIEETQKQIAHKNVEQN